MPKEELDKMLDDPDTKGDVVEKPEFGTEEQQETEQQVEQVEPEPKEPEVKVEETEETESQVEKLFDQKEGQTVPLKDHIKLRQRAQKAEAEIDTLKNQTPPAAENAETNVLSELADLVEGTDEYVEKQTLKKVVSKIPDVMQQIASTAVNTALQQVSDAATMSKARTDEVAFKKDHPDYDKIVEVAKTQKMLTVEQLGEIFKSPNIAEAYYNAANEAIGNMRSVMGIEPSKPELKQPPGGEPVVDDEEFVDDDAAFDALHNPPAA